MAAWSRPRTSFSSLPTTTTTSPSSSPPSSSASLHPSLLLDLADELWFYRSVLPALFLPCLPSSSSSSSSSAHLSPDPSTLIAQCMITDFSPSPPHLPPSSSSSSSSPRAGSDPSLHTQYLPWGRPALYDYPAPHSNGEDEKTAIRTYNENAYRWYASTSDSDDDEDDYSRYPRPGVGEDEDANHYYTAPSDWDDEDAYHGYAAHSDCEDEQQIKEDAERRMVLPAYPPKLRERLEPDDALSGIYDVGNLLKDQHYKAAQEVSDNSVTDSQFPEDTVSVVSALPHIQVSSYGEQAAMKENIKLWAHAVALTLPWKAAAKARPLL